MKDTFVLNIRVQIQSTEYDVKFAIVKICSYFLIIPKMFRCNLELPHLSPSHSPSSPTTTKYPILYLNIILSHT